MTVQSQERNGLDHLTVSKPFQKYSDLHDDDDDDNDSFEFQQCSNLGDMHDESDIRGSTSDVANESSSFNSSSEPISKTGHTERGKGTTSHLPSTRTDQTTGRRNPQATPGKDSSKMPQHSRHSSVPPPKVRRKAKEIDEEIDLATRSTRKPTRNHSPKRVASDLSPTPARHVTRPRDKSITRSRGLSLDASTRRARERTTLDASSQREKNRASSKDRKDRNVETSRSRNVNSSSRSPRSRRQTVVADSMASAIQRRAGRKTDALGASRHGDRAASQSLNTSIHGRRKAATADSLSTSRHGKSTHPQTRSSSVQGRRPSSNERRKNTTDALGASTHRRAARKEDHLGGSRHGASAAQSLNTSIHGRGSRTMVRKLAAAENVGTSSTIRRQANKQDPLCRSRHGEATASESLNTSVQVRRCHSAERRRPASDSLSASIHRRAARKDDLLGGSRHDSKSTAKNSGFHPQRRTIGGAPTTPSNGVKTSVDRLQNLSRLLADSNLPTEKNEIKKVDIVEVDVLGDLLTKNFTPKELRRALNAHKRAEETKREKELHNSPKKKQDQPNQLLDSKKHVAKVPSQGAKETRLSTCTNDHPRPPSSLGYHFEMANIELQDLATEKEKPAPRSRYMRRHSMDHGPKQPSPQPHFSRSNSLGDVSEDGDPESQDISLKSTRPVRNKRMVGKQAEMRQQNMNRDRKDWKKSVKDSIFSILDDDPIPTRLSKT